MLLVPHTTETVTVEREPGQNAVAAADTHKVG